MAGFANVGEISEAIEAGKHIISCNRKVLPATPAAGVWYDTSMWVGNPVPNYYASTPLRSATLSRSNDNGLNHGTITGDGKYLKSVMITNNGNSGVPNVFIMCDYLLYYPFIEEADVQTLENTVTLPRYTDGEGVMMLPVVQGTHAGGAQFNVTYTNTNNVSKTTPNCNITYSSTINSSILHSSPANYQNYGPFIPLSVGDTGVKSVENVTFLSPDTGIFALVLVKPLATIVVTEASTPAEREWVKDFPGMPRVEDDAFLGMLQHCSVTASAGVVMHAMTEFVWN
jgi:hypothetical protein